MTGRRVLLINPPLLGGVAFTRQGRCQEREDVLGTTKPPYSLVVIASLLRERGVDFRLIDLTAEGIGTAEAIRRLERDRFRPDIVIFCTTTPTLSADVDEMRALKRHFDVPLFCFGPHASCAPRESMLRAPDVDGMIVGEPEEGAIALATIPSLDQLDGIPSLTFRRNGEIIAHKSRGGYADFPSMPYPAWDLLPLERYTLPLVGKPYVLVETSRGCPYSCDFCVVPFHQGHKFREREAKTIVDEIERSYRQFGVDYFYLWGDTVTLNAKTFGVFCDELIARALPVRWFGNARADNLIDPAFVMRLKRSGCWMLSMGIESASDDIRQNMLKRLERTKILTAFGNLRDAGIKSFAFFIYGYPGDTVASMEQTTRFALELDPDFANFYPAVPYPGTELYEKCKREGLLQDEDWSKMEYSYYLLNGHGLDAQIVMGAIRDAKRRFFMRPKYFARHARDLARLVTTKPDLVWAMARRTLLGTAVIQAGGPEPAVAS
jgi:radical SAM superfamily enzyme YgiQ (UPF0313 family)